MARALLALLPALLSSPALAQDGMEQQRCVWGCLSAFGPNTNPAYHQCVAERCAATPVPAAGLVPAGPGDWGDLDGLIRSTIGQPLVEGSNTWLPDSADPMAARTALVFHYYLPPHGGNAMALTTALYRKVGDRFALAGIVRDLYGQNPRNARFGPGAIEVTTTMPGPNDPRCCPTAEAVWRVDLATLSAVRLR